SSEGVPKMFRRCSEKAPEKFGENSGNVSKNITILTQHKHLHHGVGCTHKKMSRLMQKHRAWTKGAECLSG
ncbi:MAG: hypothetical protein WC096_08915, partial [Sphaerochaetaceae bacterium]